MVLKELDAVAVLLAEILKKNLVFLKSLNLGYLMQLTVFLRNPMITQENF